MGFPHSVNYFNSLTYWLLNSATLDFSTPGPSSVDFRLLTLDSRPLYGTDVT